MHGRGEASGIRLLIGRFQNRKVKQSFKAKESLSARNRTKRLRLVDKPWSCGAGREFSIQLYTTHDKNLLSETQRQSSSMKTPPNRQLPDPKWAFTLTQYLADLTKR